MGVILGGERMGWMVGGKVIDIVMCFGSGDMWLQGLNVGKWAMMVCVSVGVGSVMEMND